MCLYIHVHIHLCTHIYMYVCLYIDRHHTETHFKGLAHAVVEAWLVQGLMARHLGWRLGKVLQFGCSSTGELSLAPGRSAFHLVGLQLIGPSHMMESNLLYSKFNYLNVCLSQNTLTETQNNGGSNIWAW